MSKPAGTRKTRTDMKAEEARRAFSDLLERVAYQGERIVVTRFGKELVAIVGMDDYATLDGAA